MIVISDGQPACNAYSSISGYSDTKDAIREARGKNQNVLGVAIGADIERLHDMYGNDFVSSNPQRTYLQVLFRNSAVW